MHSIKTIQIIPECRFKKFINHDIEQGIPLSDKQFDIVLCNYVLMFIEPSKINKVVDDLMRVTRDF